MVKLPYSPARNQSYKYNGLKPQYSWNLMVATIWVVIQ